MRRQLHLNLFIHGRGHHEASWHHPASSPLALTDIRYYQDLAQRVFPIRRSASAPPCREAARSTTIAPHAGAAPRVVSTSAAASHSWIAKASLPSLTTWTSTK